MQRLVVASSQSSKCLLIIRSKCNITTACSSGWLKLTAAETIIRTKNHQNYLQKQHFSTSTIHHIEHDFSNDATSGDKSSNHDDEEVNYFKIMNMATKYDVDMNLLEKRYKDFQRQYHPDKFANAPPVRITITLCFLLKLSFSRAL